jgi:hypothetical protein
MGPQRVDCAVVDVRALSPEGIWHNVELICVWQPLRIQMAANLFSLNFV